MHRSRIGVVLIDHTPDHFDAGVRFWAGAQGVRPVVEDDVFTSVGEAGTLSLAVQRLDEGPARVHLDIETDDVPAEVARLQALGASVVEERTSHVIMADPGGIAFCVVPVQTGDRFVEDSLEWE